jgi:hypothetical protein
MRHGGPVALGRYGDSGGRACGDGSDRLAHRSVAMAWRPAMAGASTLSLPTSRATGHKNAAQVEVMPCRLVVMKSRRVVGA